MRQFLNFVTPIQSFNDAARRRPPAQIIDVYTDKNGGFVFLAQINLREFAKVADFHFKIVDSSYSETEKLRLLILIWFPIDDRISGYLTGDLPENNP
jgi:hypothetical protein